MKRLIELVKESANTLYNLVYSYLKKNENERILLFRVLLLFIWINLFAIFILGKINPFHLLNPAKFLSLPPVDTRKEIVLFYPASIEDLHEKSDSSEKSNIVELHQKASIDENYTPSNRENLIVQNAWGIIEQLSTAPDSLRGVRAIKDELLVKKIWFYEGRLIVHLDLAIINSIKEKQRNILVNCIRKSIQANLGAFSEVAIVIQ